jgi:pimeloyl-ACP methyl ester carboxylesterase
MMITRHNFFKALVTLILFGCVNAFGQSTTNRQLNPSRAVLGKGFHSSTIGVNGTTLHYVRGGTGPAIILLHGFPEDWSAYRHVMPRLARKFTVVAVDLRGVGGSAATPGGYDAANLAEDIHQLAERLTLGKIYLAGHDVGGHVAYAFARRYPQTLRGVMILDVPLPGLEPWGEVTANPKLWHVGFHQTPRVPERLIAGRQFFYFREYFFSPDWVRNKAVSDGDVARYAKAYAAPQHLRAGLEMYRAFPADEKFNQAQRDQIDLPFVLVAGENSFAGLLPKLAEDLRAHGCGNVSVEVVKNGRHYLADEQPEAVAALIERYASQ